MNSITRIISHALAASLMVFLAACSESGDGVLYEDDLPTAEAPAAPTPDPGPGNIVEVATESGSFPTLLAAVEAAGLVDALSDSSASLTVFAPTEAAFAALPEGTLDSLLADPDALANVLTYHVLGSSVDASAVLGLAPTTVETLNGNDIAVTKRDDENLYVNLSKVVDYDIEASNGVIHVIDSVLLPPDLTPSTMTIAEIAQADGNFDTLVAALTAANLVGTVNDPDASLTVFAPTDAAFEELGDAALNYLLNNPEILESTLLYHVVAGAELSSIDAIAAAGTSLTMANDDEATISLGETGLMIEGANIVTTDIVASNGIIHVIDVVLEAPSATGAPLAVTLASNGSFSTLAGLIEDAGLTDELMDPNANVTIFAPTDDAFAQMKRAKRALAKDGAGAAVVFTGPFGGAIYDVDTSTYTFPSGAQTWAGFANEDTTVYPFTFPEGGSITFTASAAAPTSLKFKFEKNPFPDTEPSFETETVLIDSTTAQQYTVEFAAQGENTFSSFLLYLIERDSPVVITDVMVTSGAAEPEPEPDADLVNLLTYHVYGDTVYSDAAIALAGNSIEMLNGESVDISVDADGNLLINDAKVTTADIAAGNGVIHAINKVLTLPGEPSVAAVEFTGTFGGAIYDVDTSTYTFPSGAQTWAGFANEDTTVYPFTFPEGGSITFTASAAAPTSLKFKFEKNPFPDTEPSFETETVLIDSTTAQQYTVEFAAQGENTFSSFLLYLIEQDSPVVITDVMVTSGAAAEPEPENPGASVVFTGTFGGAIYDVDTSTYTFPSGAQTWAGFANEDTTVYPFTFPEGGSITFTASAAAPTSLKFKFEKNPFPDTEPSFETETVLIDSTTAQQYTVEFAAQGENTFSSFLLYLIEQDSPVVITDVMVTSGAAAEPEPENPGASVVFTGTFGGAIYDVDTSTYTFPSGAQTWAGFANEDTTVYPFTFPEGGSITFTASAAAPTSLKFKFEKNPFPDTEPSFETETVLIDSTTAQQYTVEFAAQGENTFSSFLLYLIEQDSPVVVTEVVVRSN